MNGGRLKIVFHTLGCKLNYTETSAISRSFPESRFERVMADSKADIYVINTCSVTGAAEKKCRQAIKKFIHRSPGAFIAVTGCYAQLRPQDIAAIPGVDLVLGTNEKFDLVAYMKNLSKRDVPEVHSSELPENQYCHPAFSVGDRTRSFLKVQDGCDYGCAYCTVPLARGNSRNQDIASLKGEAEKIAQTGTKEIVITGVNTGDFGKTTGESFILLLKELIKVHGIERYRISSIEPNLLTDEIIELIAEGNKLMPHLHIPLQSGSDRILGLMKRRYRREMFERSILSVKEKIPLAGIGADVIVGFPGETDYDFEETYSFLRDMPLSYLHVFTYSARPGTVAYSMRDRTTFRVKEERSKRLIALSEEKHLGFCRLNLGKISEVLFESGSRKMITGFTENYLKAEHPCDYAMRGRIKKVLLKAVSASGNMTAEII